VANEIGRRLVERVRQLREARGLTQEAFAERAGLKYKHYQAIEAGRKLDFKMSTLAKLAKACGLDPWELFHDEAMESAVAEAPARYGQRKARGKKRAASRRN
jgi:transcriptional regulator with XRE-family HTH domain